MDLNTILELISQRHHKDIESVYNDFILMTNVLTDFVDGLSNIEVDLPNRFEYFEIQLVKLVLVSNSLVRLFEGSDIKLKGKMISYPDLSSIFTLKRSQLENYMTFYYLYEDKIHEDQAKFRYFLYKASGLNSRQKFDTLGVEKYMKIKEKDLKKIENLKGLITSNNYFKSLGAKERKRILNFLPAKEKSWVRLFKESDINSDLFLTQWKLYSNYAHSEQISSMQLKAYFYDFEELKSTFFSSLETSIYPLCLSIINLTKRFEQIKVKFDCMDKSVKTKIIFRYNLSIKQDII